MAQFVIGFFTLFTLGLLVLFIWGMFARKKIFRKYDGELRVLPSVLHAFVMFSIALLIIGPVIFVVLNIQQTPFRYILMSLFWMAVGIGIGYLYVKIRSKSLLEKFPEAKIERILFDQFLMGIGNFVYTYLCVIFIVLIFFGIPLFQYGADDF